jgi:SAM-dependent methyltransferase
MTTASLQRQGDTSFLKRVVRVNQRVSRALTPPHIRETSVFSMYTKIVSILLMQPQTKRVLDAGAGAAWSLPQVYKQRFGLHLVGLDIDPKEMERNVSLDERIVSDVCREIPVPDGSIDVITAHSGVEHFPDNEAFLGNCFKALRPGGRVVAQFPSRYAPFVIVNRVLPYRASRFLLKHFRPDAYDQIGFPAHYDRTNYSDFRRIAESAGFEFEYVYFGYFNFYCAFFVPLYILSMTYGLMRLVVGAKDFASYNLVVLRKPGPNDDVTFGHYSAKPESLHRESSRSGLNTAE